MNISMIKRKRVALFSLSVNNVLKPAVLAVTAWKKEVSNFEPIGNPASVFCHSINRTSRVPAKSSEPVTANTVLVCRESLLGRSKLVRRFMIFRSAMTKKPSPPKMIRAVIVRFTNRSPRKETKLVWYREKPALQKAEIE